MPNLLIWFAKSFAVRKGKDKWSYLIAVPSSSDILRIYRQPLPQSYTCHYLKFIKSRPCRFGIDVVNGLRGNPAQVGSAAQYQFLRMYEVWRHLYGDIILKDLSCKRDGLYHLLHSWRRMGRHFCPRLRDKVLDYDLLDMSVFFMDIPDCRKRAHSIFLRFACTNEQSCCEWYAKFSCTYDGRKPCFRNLAWTSSVRINYPERLKHESHACIVWF